MFAAVVSVCDLSLVVQQYSHSSRVLCFCLCRRSTATAAVVTVVALFPCRVYMVVFSFGFHNVDNQIHNNVDSQIVAEKVARHVFHVWP